jgi:hypothetical protein
VLNNAVLLLLLLLPLLLAPCCSHLFCSGLDLPPGALLKLRDVVLEVTQQQLQQYIGFMLSVPQVRGRSWLTGSCCAQVICWQEC